MATRLRAERRDARPGGLPDRRRGRRYRCAARDIEHARFPHERASGRGLVRRVATTPGPASGAFGGDEVEHEARPAEARGALTLGGARVVELADPALRLHLDRAARELARDVGEAVLPQTPVQVPVDADPGRSAPRGPR